MKPTITITITGAPGSGKSVVASLIAFAIRSAGVRVVHDGLEVCGRSAARDKQTEVVREVVDGWVEIKTSNDGGR